MPNDFEPGLPSLSPKDKNPLASLRTNRKIRRFNRLGLSDKTLWDWLELLVVPLVLAIGGFWFSSQQNQISFQASQRQHETDIQIATDQQRETTLETYLDDMATLLLNSNLRDSHPTDEVRIVARARTLSALSRLDPVRKVHVLRFLTEAGLLSIVGLDDADLSYVRLVNALPGIVHNVTIQYASLTHAYLENYQMNHIELNYSDLSYSTFTHFTVVASHLKHVNLRHSKLDTANFSNCSFTQADLSDAILSNVNFENTDLSQANFNGAVLSDVDFRGAIITSEQLTHAKSLSGVIMPDGATHL
jgi:uncharacterized protein YjbI with pentapeptide repeats